MSIKACCFYLLRIKKSFNLLILSLFIIWAKDILVLLLLSRLNLRTTITSVLFNFRPAFSLLGWKNCFIYISFCSRWWCTSSLLYNLLKLWFKFLIFLLKLSNLLREVIRTFISLFYFFGFFIIHIDCL